MKVFIFLILFIPSLAYSAGQVNRFKIEYVRVDNSGKGIIKFEKRLTGSPASCIKGHPQHLSFNLNTEAGKGIMSLALAAHTAGKTITARGSGRCSHYGSVESWDWGIIDK